MRVFLLERNVSRAACHVQTFLASKETLLAFDQVACFKPTKIYVPVARNKEFFHGTHDYF